MLGPLAVAHVLQSFAVVVVAAGYMQPVVAR